MEELGIPTHIHSALSKAKTPSQLVQNIDPPFACEIDLDVSAEQADAPQPGKRRKIVTRSFEELLFMVSAGLISLIYFLFHMLVVSSL